MKIAMVVLNSVCHDTRVVKEADSLALAGFDVRVFGIRDERVEATVFNRPSGAWVMLADPKATAMRRVSFWMQGIALLSAGLLLAFFQVCAWVPSLFGQAVGLVLVGAVFFYAQREADRVERLARKLEGLSDEPLGLDKVSGIFQNLRLVLFRKAYRLECRKVIRAFIADFSPAVVHCHDANTLEYGLWWKKKNRPLTVMDRILSVHVPRISPHIIFDSHELCHEQHGLTEAMKDKVRAIQKKAAPKLDAVITVNDSIAGKLVKAFGLMPCPVVIRNAVRLADMPQERDHRLRLFLEQKSLVTSTIVLYHGGLSQYRNLAILPEVARRLGEPFKVVVMGDGPYRDELIRLGKDVKNFHVIAGVPRAELLRWASSADFGIIPYAATSENHRYCTPNKLWEYPGAGVPVIAPNLPEIARIVVGEGIGWILPEPMTALAVATLIRSITGEEHDTRRKACRRFIEKDSWEKYSDTLVNLYRRMMP